MHSLSIFISFLAVIFLLLVQCKGNQSGLQVTKNKEKDELPLITTYDQIEGLSGQKVRLKGIYREFDVRMRKENPKELFNGHVAIYMEDNWPVILYPPSSENSLRSQNERNQMSDNQVIVSGVIFRIIPGSFWATSQGIPCLVDIEEIVLASDESEK